MRCLFWFIDEYYCEAPDEDLTNCTIEFQNPNGTCKHNENGLYHASCKITFKAENGSGIKGNPMAHCQGTSPENGNWREENWPTCYKKGNNVQNVD